MDHVVGIRGELMTTGRVYYLSEEGEKHLLGETIFITSPMSHDKMVEVLLDAHWDERLRSSSCIPVVEIDHDEEEDHTGENSV